MIRARAVQGALLALAVVVLAACTSGSTRSDATTTTPSRTTAAPIDSFAGMLLAVVIEDVDETWVNELLVVVDPTIDEVVGRIALGDPIASEAAAITARIEVSGDVAWVTRTGETSTTVFRVPAGVAEADATAEVAFSDAALVLGAGAAWMSAGTKLVQLDLTTGATTSEIPLDPLGAGFVAVDVAVAGGAVYLSSDAGGLARYEPATAALEAQPALVATCYDNPTSREQFAANAQATILDITTIGPLLVAATSSGCTPDPAVTLVDPTAPPPIPSPPETVPDPVPDPPTDPAANPTVPVPTTTTEPPPPPAPVYPTIALPTAPFQALTVVPAGTGALIARADTNDIVPVDLTTLVAEPPIALPADTLAETCTGSVRLVVCVGGLDDLVVGDATATPIELERRNVSRLRGTVLAWGIAA